MENKLIEKKDGQQQSGEEFEVLCEIIREILPAASLPPVIYPDHSLKHLGFNSIEYINLFLNLENRLDIDIETIADKINLAEIQTMQDLVNLVITLRSK